MRKFLFLALLCPFLAACAPMELQAQTAIQPTTAGEFDTKELSPPLQALSIGDPVPDILLQNLLNHPASNAKLRSFKQRLIILDFWATWCTSCLHGFPKLDSLQQRFGDSLGIILVNEKTTRDNESRIQSFFEKHRSPAGKPYLFPTLVRDTSLCQLFPHTLIPHYVWILDGKVAAITGGSELNAANVQSLLVHNAPKLQTKNDVLNYDRNVPLFTDGNGATTAATHFRALICGYLEGVPSGTIIQKNKEGHITRICVTNSSILSLYKHAWQAFTATVQINVKDPSKLTKAGSWDLWKYDNAWTYELISPPSSTDELLRHMQHDLFEFFGYRGTLTLRTGQKPLFIISDK